MSFLNTTILFLSGLALIPILIHLFNRQRVKKIEFSSIRYLKTLQKTRMRRLKIKQLLLLILRTLAILALVIAFARPTTEGSYSAMLGSAARASIVILIDNSLSMSAETKEGSLFEIAREQALNICDNIDAHDEVALLSFNRDVHMRSNGFTGNHSFIMKALNSIHPTRMGTDPKLALESAFELLSESDNYVREIYLFSDLAGPEWQAATFDDLPRIENLKIYVSRIVKEDYDNLKVTNLNFGKSLIYPGRPVNIAADIINEGSRRVDNILISLFVDQKRISQTDLSIAASGSEKVNFSHTFGQPGEHTGYIELTDDDLIEDNRAFFTINIPAGIDILTLYENEDDDLFLKLAIRPLPESPSQVEISSEPISRLASLDLFDYDCVVVSNAGILSQAGFSKLASYVKTGGSLFMFVSDDLNKDILNDKIFGPAFGNAIRQSLRGQQGTGFYRISSLNFGHPIFGRYQEIDPDYLPEIDFYNILKVTKPSRGNILASFSTGDPAIIETEWGNGRILAVFSSPSREDSDIVDHPFFVTFINRAAEYLAYDLARLRENFQTGIKISKTLLNIKPQQAVEIITPSSEKIAPAYSFSGAELNLNIPPIETNGICEIMVDNEVIERFAVNFPPAESDGRFLTLGDLKKTLSQNEIIELKNTEDFGLIIKESRLGRELSKIFFILALVFLAAEMLLARGSSQPAAESK
jgi:hypothetical protein